MSVKSMKDGLTAEKCMAALNILKTHDEDLSMSPISGISMWEYRVMIESVKVAVMKECAKRRLTKK